MIHIEGIPLTEEWLLKMGFDRSNSGYIFLWKKIGALTLEARINSDHVYLEILGALYLGRIKYVHHLQNLYFSLVGQELTIS